MMFNLKSANFKKFSTWGYINNYAAVLILFLGLLIVYISFVSPSSLIPTNLSWLGETDLRQHYLGWYAYRMGDEIGPLWGQTKLLNYPLGVPIVGTDSNPLYSFIFAPFSSMLPEDFQFIGLSYLINMSLSLFFAYLLLIKLKFDKVTAALFAIFLAFPPIFFWRFGHDTLTTQWLILAHFYVSLNVIELRRTVLLHAFFLTLAILTHPYLFVMNFIIVVCDIFIKCVKQYGLRWGVLERTSLAIVAVLFVGLYVGYKTGVFSLKTKTLNEVGVFSSDIIALFNPFSTSTFLPNLPAANGQYEGYAYLGAGGISLIFVIAVLHYRGKTHTINFSNSWMAITIAAVLGFLIALGPALPLAGNATLAVDLGDDSIIAKIMSKIRSHGRFVWILNYALMLVLIALLPRTRLFLLRGFAVLLISFQLLDLAPLRATTIERTAQVTPRTNPFITTEWEQRFRNADFVYLSSQFDFERVLDIAEAAFKQKVPVSRFYTAQGLGLPDQQVAADLLRIATLNGDLNSSAIYLFDNDVELPIVHRQSSNLLFTKNLGDYSAVNNQQFDSSSLLAMDNIDLAALHENCLENCTMIIATNGETGSYISEQDRTHFASLDSKITVLNAGQNYAGIIRNGQVVEESLTVSESASVVDEKAGRFVSVKSASPSQNTASILVNGIDYARQLKGVSVALVYDNGDIITALLDKIRAKPDETKNKDLLSKLSPSFNYAGDALLDNYAIISRATPFLNLDRYLSENSSLAEILAKCKQGCSMAISIKDEATASLPREVRALAGQMGLALSELEFRDGFAAIIEDGIVLVQARSHNDVINISEQTRGRSIKAISAGFSAGSQSSLQLDDRELSFSKRGVNVVVFNETQEITYHFDTHGS